MQRKGKKFEWTPQCDEAFKKLKEALTSAPVLIIPDPNGSFEVWTDASLEGFGGILTQDGKVVAYESRKLKPHELNYPPHDLELAAVVHALKMWRHFLLGKPFKLRTDHKSLEYLFTQENLNARQRRWLELISDYDMDIKYVKGKENRVADALSWRLHFVAISRL